MGGWGAIPVTRNINRVDVAQLGPFRDLSFHKLRRGLDPDTLGRFGGRYRGVVGESYRSDSTQGILSRSSLRKQH